MLRFEDSLPRLPVPSLEETAARYLKSLQPLLSASELATSRKAVDDFIAPDGPGRKLQKKLLARRDDGRYKNWLYDWWNEAAYLSYRDPVVPYVSYFYSHRDDRRRRDAATRAAAITAAALAFKEQVDAGTLEPEYAKKLPLSMHSYQWMFNASRVAARPADRPVKFEAGRHKYVVVVRRNHFFKLAHEVDGQPLNTAELEQAFRRVYELASTERAPPVGALTSEQRDMWADARQRLVEAGPDNAAALEAIEASSFVVCLDDAAPVTLEERAHAYWHGDGQNRWYDKPLQFIVNDNGTSGFTGEHSMMDGTPTHRLNVFVNRALLGDDKGSLDRSESASVRAHLPEPTRLRFAVTSAVRADMDRALHDFAAVMARHQLAVQPYQGYGKGLIKKLGCSPDAYVQMLIQLAYRNMHGRNRPTYESAATRRFQQGRTETCRSVSTESVAWCDAMTRADVDDATCVALFRDAMAAHVEYLDAAGDGRGVDRHLFGLRKLLAPTDPLPALYADPAFAYSGSWYLSTSQLSSEYYNGYGWSQVMDDGFGIAYMINENSIQFNVVSKHRGSDRMSFHLQEAANDMRDLLEPTIMQAPKAKL